MIGWHHQLDGHEFVQALGDGDGQGGLVCYSPRGCKDLDSIERLNNNISSNGNFSKSHLFPMPKLYSYSSVTQSCLTLCDPMDCSTPGLPVHHQLLELAQTHVH